ncbi:MAG: RnfABCDGE type electron transport complex subunit B [Mogibacterium sp.]|nr:RnfABCDGE type electron transport complex subunit B [Mogibacterium sp.]
MITVAAGLVASILLTVASKVFYVPVDERVAMVREALPGANCGGCGFAGCDDFAANIVNDESIPCNGCPVGGASAAAAIAEILGRNAGSGDRQVAHVMCNGTCGATGTIAEWQGMQSCKGAKTYYNGSGKCAFGCMGFGDCAAVCDFNAIGVIDGVAKVNRDNCVACGKCVTACPQKIVRLVPEKAQVHVLCSNKDKGGVTRKACANGCIGCGKCAKVCKFEAIKIDNNLASIDVSKCKNCGMCLKECPTGAINSYNIKHAKLAIKAKEKAEKERAEKAAAAAKAKAEKEAAASGDAPTLA